MTRSDMVEDGSVEESPSEAGDTQPQASQAQSGDGEPEGAAQREGEVEASQEELQGSQADDSELVHFAAGRCSDDEPLSALTPEGAKQLQGEPPQLEESQGHEVSQLDPEPSEPNESFRALYERLAHSEPEPAASESPRASSTETEL